MRILLIGYGRMGHLVEAAAVAAGDTVVGTIDSGSLGELDTMGRVADVAIDFSAPAAQSRLADYIRRTGTPLLSGVTGLTEEQLASFDRLGQYAPVLHSANYSVGIAVFRRVLEQIGGVLRDGFDIEITETHHRQKADAPSGTAKLLLQAIDPGGELRPVYGRDAASGRRDGREIGIHAIRGGTMAGQHTVHFFGLDEVFEINHTAYSPQIFASGALQMARRLCGLPNGRYDLQQILFGGTDYDDRPGDHRLHQRRGEADAGEGVREREAPRRLWRSRRLRRGTQ